jgi:hypothetical protein
MKVDIRVRVTENFKKAAKSLIKKYPSLKSVESKGKGKMGGVRILTHIIVNLKIDDTGLTKLYMVYIYDKSELGVISDKELMKMIKDIKREDEKLGIWPVP